MYWEMHAPSDMDPIRQHDCPNCSHYKPAPGTHIHLVHIDGRLAWDCSQPSGVLNVRPGQTVSYTYAVDHQGSGQV
jgi:hypothetical protein